MVCKVNKMSRGISAKITLCFLYSLILTLSACTTTTTELQNEFNAGDIFQAEFAEIVNIVETKYFQQVEFNKNNFSEAIESMLHVLDSQHLILQQTDVDRLVNQYTDKDLTKSGYKNLNRVIDEFIALEQVVLNEQFLVYLMELDVRAKNLQEDMNGGRRLPKDAWANSKTEWLAKLNAYVANDVIYTQQQGYDLDEIEERLSIYYSRVFGNNVYLTNRKRFELVVNALMGVVDTDSSYFLNAENSGSFTLTGNLEGIGLTISEDLGSIKVGKLLPGGPADTAGTINEGDSIVGISQDGLNFDPTFTMTLDDVVRRMRGESGSKVHLQLRRENTLETVAVQRGPVTLKDQVVESELKNLVVGDKTYRIGVITVPSFYMDFQAYRNRDPNYKSSSRDVKLAIANLRNDDVEGIVLDLRNNGGGSLAEGRSMSALFIDAGPVMQLLQGRAGKVFRDEVRDTGYVYKGPVVILVNQKSAGSSEIVAGTVQDYGVGVVVGQRTFGYGIVQSLTNTSLGMIKLTENEIYRVTGTSYQIHGVQPDIELRASATDTNDDLGQRFKEKTVQPGEIQAANFTAYNRVTNEQKDTLKKHYTERVSKRSADDSGESELMAAVRIAADLIQVQQ